MGEMIGFAYTNPGGTGGKWDICLCFGCGGVDGVCGSGMGAWAMVWEGEWNYVCVCCESGFCVLMADLGICILCFADTCAS